MLTHTAQQIALELRKVATVRANTAASLPRDITPAEAYGLAFNECMRAVGRVVSPKNVDAFGVAVFMKETHDVFPPAAKRLNP